MSTSAAPERLGLEFGDEDLEVFYDKASGLRGAVAAHSTVLGPAMGGVRLASYPELEELVADALALSRTMTLKHSASGLGLGAGKAALLDDGVWATQRERRFVAFAPILNRFGGRHITAEDADTTAADIDHRRLAMASTQMHIQGVSPAALIDQPVDILGPCAPGGVIGSDDVPRLRCQVTVGPADDPLDDDVAVWRHQRRITYVPDLVANRGGIIHVASDVLGFVAGEVRLRIHVAVQRTIGVLFEATACGLVPLDLVKRIATERLTSRRTVLS